MGADRICMPSPNVEQFVEAVKATVIANKRWVALIPIIVIQQFIV